MTFPEQLKIHALLNDDFLRRYVFANLTSSLRDIGFSEVLVNELILSIDKMRGQPFDVCAFGKKHAAELDLVYSKGFFQEHVPAYFSKNVLPSTPAGEKIVDIGCGTGILAKLYSQNDEWKEIVGIDIDPYPEWSAFKNEKVRFEVVKEDGFVDFMKKEQPSLVALTWTLHHMAFMEQERYVRSLYGMLKPGSWIIVLEDSYSADLEPEEGKDIASGFFSWTPDDRLKIMSVNDWVANRVLAQRSKVPIPFAYRTLEEWEKLFQSIGFKTHAKRFIGSPRHRDINTPQSLIVFER